MSAITDISEVMFVVFLSLEKQIKPENGYCTGLLMCMCVSVDNTTLDAAYASTPWVWAVPSSWYKRVIWVMSWPLIAAMFVTVPDCRQQRWRHCFIVTFIMSIAWIGVFSYLMVWMITVVGLCHR